MAAYRKRPVVIEAVQLAGTGEDPSEEVLNWLHARSDRWESDRDEGIAIKTPGGVMRADPGDWIIEGVNDELYPCKPDIFAKSYEPIAETQKSISDWADATFGAAGSNARVAARANEEVAELLRALTADDNHPKAAEEIADAVIIFNRLATRLGVNLQEEVDKKMAINRKREWKQDDTGHGYHIRDKSAS